MNSEKASADLAAIEAGTLRPSRFPTTSGSCSREYLRPDEAAAMLDVHPKTLERWAAKDSTLPVLKIAGTTRFPRERFLKWLRDREQGRPAGRQPSNKLLLSTCNGVSAKDSA